MKHRAMMLWLKPVNTGSFCKDDFNALRFPLNSLAVLELKKAVLYALTGLVLFFF